MDRRKFFGATAVAVAALSAPAAAYAFAQPEHSWFVVEARELVILTDRVNKDPSNDDLADYWSQRLDTFIRRVEELPVTPDHAAIRALAIAVLHHDEPDEWTMDMAADSRLAGQMVQCLTGRSV